MLLLLLLLLFTCRWLRSDRPACGSSITVHQFRLLNVLVTQSSRISQLCTPVFACDSCSSTSEGGGMVVHHTVVIIRDSARVDGTWRHLSELRSVSWKISGKRIEYVKNCPYGVYAIINARINFKQIQKGFSWVSQTQWNLFSGSMHVRAQCKLKTTWLFPRLSVVTNLLSLACHLAVTIFIAPS